MDTILKPINSTNRTILELRLICFLVSADSRRVLIGLSASGGQVLELRLLTFIVDFLSITKY